MKINNILLWILLILSQITFGQIEKEVRGKIHVDSISVEGINIRNKSSTRATVSDVNGLFSILAKEGDILEFSAVNLISYQLKISLKEWSQDEINIKMAQKSITLKEVTVKQNNITAERLGIIPYGQVKLTRAERKIFTATSGGGIDGLLNAISGRTAMLKKELAVEKKEQLLEKTALLFEDKYYVETLKIPVEHIQGFQYYCIDNKDFAAAVNSKNKTLVLFLIVPMAETYNHILQNEN
jgi:hypothetical protein